MSEHEMYANFVLTKNTLVKNSTMPFKSIFMPRKVIPETFCIIRFKSQMECHLNHTLKQNTEGTAFIEAYSPPGLRSVRISNESEKMAQFTQFQHGVNLHQTSIRILW